jgi:hypothetical protein
LAKRENRKSWKKEYLTQIGKRVGQVDILVFKGELYTGKGKKEACT